MSIVSPALSIPVRSLTFFGKPIMVLMVAGSSVIPAACQYSVSGKVNLDTNWVSKAYLSSLDRWDDFFMVFDGMVIKETPVDSTGQYHFEGTELPVEQALYRVHFVEKGHGVNSLINGTVQTNHVDFVLTDQDTVHIVPLDEVVPLGQYELQRSTLLENLELQRLKSQVLHHDVQIIQSGTGREEQLNIDSKNNDLIAYLDTAEGVFCRFLALKSIDLPFEELEKQYAALLEDVENANIHAKYVASFRQTIGSNSYPLLSRRMVWMAWALGISITLNLIAIVAYLCWWSARRKQNAVVGPGFDRLLTTKEREVLDHVVQGKSNQAIADLLFVELSTVKSHLNNIYRKTGLSDRKALIEAHLRGAKAVSAEAKEAKSTPA